jgi:hypothetical protein
MAGDYFILSFGDDRAASATNGHRRAYFSQQDQHLRRGNVHVCLETGEGPTVNVKIDCPRDIAHRYRLTQRAPASPPHNSHAIRPADG